MDRLVGEVRHNTSTLCGQPYAGHAAAVTLHQKLISVKAGASLCHFRTGGYHPVHMSNVCTLPAGPTPTILVTLMPMALSSTGASWLSLSYAQAMLARFCNEQEDLPAGQSQHAWWRSQNTSVRMKQQCSDT